MSLDLPIMEGYALTESMAICAVSEVEGGNWKLGSVGKVNNWYLFL